MERERERGIYQTHTAKIVVGNDLYTGENCYKASMRNLKKAAANLLGNKVVFRGRGGGVIGGLKV